MLRKFYSLNQHGDTMVEVLISMAVVSLILSGAYVTSNKSLQSVRDSQEHVYALKLASSQVESLTAVPPTASQISGPFCYGVDGSFQIAQSSGNCVLTNTGALATSTSQPAFNVSITSDNQPQPLYKVQIVWDTVNGKVNGGNVELYYRSSQ